MKILIELITALSLLTTTLGNYQNNLAVADEKVIIREVVSSSVENAPWVDFTPKEKNVVLRPLALAFIAKCESGDKHFDKDGSVLRGVVNKQDIGRYQVNLKYHGKQAEKLGLDLFLEEDNEAYAIYLYQKQGLIPWRYSKSCWSKYL